MSSSAVAVMSASERHDAARGFMVGMWSLGILLESYLSTQPPGHSLLLKLHDDETGDTVVSVKRDGNGVVTSLSVDADVDSTDVCAPDLHAASCWALHHTCQCIHDAPTMFHSGCS